MGMVVCLRPASDSKIVELLGNPGTIFEFLAKASSDEIDEPEFRRRFVPAAMMKADIYPAIWDRDPAEDDTLGYLCDYFLE